MLESIELERPTASKPARNRLDKEREKIGSEMFRAQTTCVLESEKMADLVKCDPTNERQ